MLIVMHPATFFHPTVVQAGTAYMRVATVLNSGAGAASYATPSQEAELDGLHWLDQQVFVVLCRRDANNNPCWSTLQRPFNRHYVASSPPILTSKSLHYCSSVHCTLLWDGPIQQTPLPAERNGGWKAIVFAASWHVYTPSCYFMGNG